MPSGDEDGESTIFEVFVHAAWAPDEDEETPGSQQGEAAERAQQQKHQEAEEAGFRRFGERISALHHCAGSLPPPAWWQDVTDIPLAVGVGGGAAAARVHALLSPLWWVDMSPNNKALVVVRDSGLTLFSAADEFSSPRADWEGLPVLGERGFQWRRVAWSQDGAILAVSEANGSATILSVNTFRATARISTLLPTRAPAVAIGFLQVGASDSAAPVHALLALSYDGVLYTHPVATVQRTKEGPAVAVAEPLDVSRYHTNVTCMTVFPGAGLVAIGGWDLPVGAASNSSPSISVWKASSDGNKYELQFCTGSHRGGAGAKGSVVGWLLDALHAASSRGKWPLDSAISKLCFGRSGRMLVALEVSGAISVLDCVARKSVQRFLPHDIPAPEEASQGRGSATAAATPTFDKWSQSWLVTVGDVSWWDDSSLVLSRRDGRVTVNSIERGLANVLKAPLGPFHYQPVVTNAISAVEGSMFVLDCRRRVGTSAAEGGEEVGASFGNCDNLSWLSRMLSGAVAAGGDSKPRGAGGEAPRERFVRRYRLISVCKTSVERLFQRKLDLRDYPAAIQLATAHGLPVDGVYQRQWEHSAVSQESIETLLAQVSDRRWVLEECRSRLTRSREGARLLSQYGIKRCDAALADSSDLDDSEQKVHIERCREVLSRRIDWLDIYDLVYPGDSLDPARLKWFCESDYTQVARLLALEEECHALVVLLKRYRGELAPKWLEILSCIPETCRPRQYEELLPACREGSVADENAGAEGVVTADEAAAWYVRRAHEIERRTGLVDNALELLEIGEKRVRSNVPATELRVLYADLSHLYMLVYECGMEDLTLEAWHAKTLMQRLQCFTDKSTAATFVSDLRDRAGPYLAALGSDEGEALLHDYLADIASSRLDWCAEVFKGSTIEEPLYTFATCNPASSTRREWKRVVPAHYVSWAPAPRDNVQGQINDDVVLVKFERDLPVREQVVLWAGSAAGTRAGVLVVLCHNDKEVEVVLSLKDPIQKGAKEGGAEAAAGAAYKVEVEGLGPRPQVPVCAVAVEVLAGHTRARVCRHRVLHDPVTMVQVALRCVYACSTVDEVTAKAMGDIYCSLPKRNSSLMRSVEDTAKYNALQDRADAFDKHLTAIEILHKYKIYKPLAFFETAASEIDTCLALIKTMCRFQVRQEKRSEAAFRNLHRDLMGAPNPPTDYGGLVFSVFSFLSPGAVNVIFLESLLDANLFDLAREVLEVEMERHQEKKDEIVEQGGASEDPSLSSSSLSSCVGVVLKVAREYFDSASSCRDDVWTNACKCLGLIPLDAEEEEEGDGEEDGARTAAGDDAGRKGMQKKWQEELRKEMRLIDAVEMLDSLGLDPLPVQIRQAKEPLEIVSRAIEQAPTMLRKHDDLLRLARLLGLTEQSDQNRVIELIARALVSASDGRSLPVTEKGGKRGGPAGGEGDKIHLTEAAPLLTKLMGAGWANVWDLCERLACEEGSALRDDERLALAAHALAHCPPRHSQRILARWQVLRDKTVLCDHGGTPADAPFVPAWSSGEGIGDKGEVWARAPKTFPVVHGFYAQQGPAGAYTPLDPYMQQQFDKTDLHARAIEEALREGVTAIAAMRSSLPVQRASGGHGVVENKRMPDVLWQRFAAAAAQGDAVLLLAVLFASSPADVVVVFHHLLLSQISAHGPQIKSAQVAKVEATARLACVACHSLRAAAKGDVVAPVAAPNAWAAACQALADEHVAIQAGVQVSLREAFAKVSAALQHAADRTSGGAGKDGRKADRVSGVSGEEAVWEVLFEYFSGLRRALAEMGDVAMEWTLRAACDPASDPAALLRKALGAETPPPAETVVAAAKVLYRWLPLESISDSAVHTALSAHQLSTQRDAASGGRGRAVAGGREAEHVLKDSTPAQRVQVAKELIETGKATPSLVREVLSSVVGDACEDKAVMAEAQRLRDMMDQASDVERRSTFDKVVTALSEEGGNKRSGAGVPVLGCDAAELHEFVDSRAAAAVGEGELLLLAQLVSFWDADAMPWCLHARGDTSTRTSAGVAAGPATERGSAAGGSVLGRERSAGGGGGDSGSGASEVAATWMVLLRRALGLRLVACALVLRSGPARYALAPSQEDELVAAAQECSASTAAHVALLSPYPTVRGRANKLLETGGETEAIAGEEVGWLVETALRCNALDIIYSSALTRSAFVTLLRGSSFPRAGSTTANGGGDRGGGGGGGAPGAVAGYAVMTSGAQMAVHIVPRRESELFALAVVQMVEAGDVVGAGMLVLRATQTHPTLASSPSASVAALQAFLLRIQSVADSAAGDDWGISEEVRSRCQEALAAFEKMLAR